MKTMLISTALGVVGLAGPAAAQAGLPVGHYVIDGTVTAISGSACPLAPNQPVGGDLYYPGVGRDTTQFLLDSITLNRAVTVALTSAFPPVPATGLNGWSTQSPVLPNYAQYRNGRLVGGGTSATLAFAISEVSLGTVVFALGSVRLVVDAIGPCDETIQAIFRRVTPPGPG